MFHFLLTIFVALIFRMKFYRLTIAMTIPKSPVASISLKLVPYHNSFAMLLVVKIPSLVIRSIRPIKLSPLIIHHVIFPFPFIYLTVWPDISPLSVHFSILKFPCVFFIEDRPTISLHDKNRIINESILLFDLYRRARKCRIFFCHLFLD